MRYYLYYLLLGLFWGGSFIGIKYAVAAVPPVAAALLRVAIGLFFLSSMFLAAQKPLLLPRRYLWKSWLTGLLGIGVPFSLLFWGEKFVNPGLAGIINGTVPIWTFLLGAYFISHLETLNKRKVAGLLLGICGVIVIFYPQLHLAEAQRQWLGIAAIFGMALCYSASNLLNRLFLAGRREVPLSANLFQQHLISAFYLLLVSLALEDWRPLAALPRHPAALFSLLYLGIISTALALLMYFTLIREWGAYRAATTTYLVTASSLFLDYLFFGNLPSPSQWLGVGTVLSGVVLLQLPGRSRKPAAAASAFIPAAHRPLSPLEAGRAGEGNGEPTARG